MAGGQGQGGGVFALPDVPSLGQETWADMAGVHPNDPLVGGRGAQGIVVNNAYRQVALGAPDPSAGAASGAPMSGNWREIFNLKGNPVGWVLIASIIYLGLAHISLQGRLGKSKAGFSSG